MDLMRISLWVGGISLVIALLCAFSITAHNLTSPKLGLATGTLFAAGVLFVIQVWFELQASEETDHITIEYTVDHAAPAIYQPNGLNMFKLGNEAIVSSWVANHNPAAFTQEQIHKEFAIASIIYFMRSQFSDWQIRVVVRKGATPFSNARILQTRSRPDECVSLPLNQINVLLKQAGNAFSGVDAPMAARDTLCLPPGSEMIIHEDELTIRNPIVELTFKLDEGFTMAFSDPAMPDMSVPLLESGKPRFATYVSGFDVAVRYSRLRAWDKNRDKYREWVKEFLLAAHYWFEGPPS